jgi:hypothetical protein
MFNREFEKEMMRYIREYRSKMRPKSITEFLNRDKLVDDFIDFTLTTPISSLDDIPPKFDPIFKP